MTSEIDLCSPSTTLYYNETNGFFFFFFFFFTFLNKSACYGLIIIKVIYRKKVSSKVLGFSFTF
jgi:hypothetical protein